MMTITKLLRHLKILVTFLVIGGCVVFLAANFSSSRLDVRSLMRDAEEMASKTFVKRGFDKNSNDWNFNLTSDDLRTLSSPFNSMLEEGRSFLIDEEKNWVKTNVILDGKKYKNAKIKISGTSGTPFRNSLSNIYGVKVKWSGTKVYDPSKTSFSYKLKLKSSNTLGGIRRLTLNTSGDQWDASTIALTELARDWGLITSDVWLKQLYVNNIDSGIYLVSEDIDKELLERDFKITNFGMYKSNDEWDKSLNKKHTSFTDYTYQDKEQSGMSPATELGLTKLKELFSVLDRSDLNDLRKYIDFDYFAKLSALEIFYGNTHSSIGDNVKYIYNFSNGFFYTSFRVEGSLKAIKKAKTVDAFEKSAEKYHDRHKIIKLLTADETWLATRDSYLMKLVAKRSEILALIKEKSIELETISQKTNKLMWPKLESSKRSEKIANGNLDKIEFYLTKLAGSNRGEYKSKDRISSFGSISEKELKDVARLKKQNLQNFVKLYATWNVTSKVAEILHVSNSESKIVKLFDCNGEEIRIATPLTLKPTLNPTGQFIQNLALPEIECLGGMTIIKGEMNIPQRHIHVNQRLEINNPEVDFEEFKNIFQGAKQLIQSNRMTWEVPQGRYVVNANMLLPAKTDLVLKPGVEIFIANGASILVKGELSALGTSELPISVDRLGKSNFGTFAVIGQNETPKVSMDYFNLQNGSEAILEGIYFSSQLSLHHTNSIIKNSQFSRSSSDDGLNIKNSNVILDRNKFFNNFGDQVDLDFCSGEVTNNQFFIDTPIGEQSSETDGLDVSGTEVLVKDNLFQNLSDKGISIGEKSNVRAEYNRIIDNNIGVAVKDGSIAELSKNSFLRNIFPITTYIKKNMYQTPKVKGDFDLECDAINPIGTSQKLYKPINLDGEALRVFSNVSQNCFQIAR